MIMDRDFSCVYALSKMKTLVLLETPAVKRHGISAFHLMDDIFGNIPALHRSGQKINIMLVVISSSCDVIRSGH